MPWTSTINKTKFKTTEFLQLFLQNFKQKKILTKPNLNPTPTPTPTPTTPKRLQYGNG